MPVKSSDIYWLAGLLEGEGFFRYSPNGTTMSIGIGMRVQDLLHRPDPKEGY